MSTSPTVHDQVREYYGERLQSTGDLKTGACCTADSMPHYVRPVLKQLEKEIISKFYGCGSPIPPALEGCTVLDLGCGTGRDSYLCSKLVGPNGRVIGVDMTEAQLDVARRHLAAQTERFGYSKPNVEFKHGYIEDLAALDIADNSVDVVISNCVINLSPNKEAIFREIFRVLKPGGELYFSDVFADRRIPDDLQTDAVLRGECLSGAMYIGDFRRMLASIGCPDFRRMSTRRIDIRDAEITERLGNIQFCSITVRAFKLASLEDMCEDFGQVAIYRGTMAEHPAAFELDDHHRFERGRAMAVCGNSAAMVGQTRFGKHFQIIGDMSTHYGLFDCGPSPAAGNGDAAASCC